MRCSLVCVNLLAMTDGGLVAAGDDAVDVVALGCKQRIHRVLPGLRSIDIGDPLEELAAGHLGQRLVDAGDAGCSVLVRQLAIEMDDVAGPADRLADELRGFVGRVTEGIVDAHHSARALEFVARADAHDGDTRVDDALDGRGAGDRVHGLHADAVDALRDEAVDDPVLLDLIELLR